MHLPLKMAANAMVKLSLYREVWKNDYSMQERTGIS